MSEAARTTLMLFLGTAGVLVVASLCGGAMRWRWSNGAAAETVENFNARVRAWWVMVAVMAMAFAAGRLGVVALFFVISFFALREFLTLTYTRRGDHAVLVAAFYVALPLQYLLVAVDWPGLFAIALPVYAFLLLPILSTMGGDSRRFLERAAKIQWGLMVCVYCISHVPALLTLHIPGHQDRTLLLIAFLVIVVQGSDVLQYVWGKLLGRRKLAPVLSPSKTWEGLLGGIASAVLLGASLAWITPFGVWQAALMSLSICIMGFLGGLVMSAIKRDRGVKDWGSAIEGHGGVLDRLDSVIFAAPVYFHLIKYFWTD